jgi:hypothetical protein
MQSASRRVPQRLPIETVPTQADTEVPVFVQGQWSQGQANAILQELAEQKNDIPVCAGWNAPIMPYVEQRSLASEVVAASGKIAGFPVCGGWNAPIVPNL